MLLELIADHLLICPNCKLLVNCGAKARMDWEHRETAFGVAPPCALCGSSLEWRTDFYWRPRRDPWV